jgi:hypothetical protein
VAHVFVGGEGLGGVALLGDSDLDACLWIPFSSFFFLIYLFSICKYTLAVFRHSRRGCQITLQMVVSHHVVAGI